jgi:hypothetical protein
MEIRQTITNEGDNKEKREENGCHSSTSREGEERRMEIRQAIQQILFGIADEIVEVTGEEKRKQEEGVNIQVSTSFFCSFFSPSFLLSL